MYSNCYLPVNIYIYTTLVGEKSFCITASNEKGNKGSEIAKHMSGHPPEHYDQKSDF